MERAKIPTISMRTDDIDDLKKQYMAELKADKDVYADIQSFNMTTKQVYENVGLLMEYKGDRDVCKTCPGLDKCPKKTKGYWSTIDFDGKNLSFGVCPCKKVAEILELRSRFWIQDFPDEWLGKDLLTVDKSNNRNEIIKSMVAIAKGQSNRWLFINGSYKSGRTYLTVALANTLAKKGKEAIAFCDTTSLVDKLKDLSFNSKDEFSKAVDRLCSTPVVVFDDFGNEQKSEFVFSSLLFPIINARSKAGLLTIFTSDFTIKEIGEMYSDKVSTARGNQL
ncbi:MAG: ATP-binding protein, partial [Bacilli bacterium]|nr:ATP-binding protein [Bacilli bacterium]